MLAIITQKCTFTKDLSPSPMITFLKSILNFAPRWGVILIYTSHENAVNDLDIFCLILLLKKIINACFTIRILTFIDL